MEMPMMAIGIIALAILVLVVINRKRKRTFKWVLYNAYFNVCFTMRYFIFNYLLVTSFKGFA